MKNLPLLLGTIVGTLILVVGVAVIFSSSSTANDPAQTVEDMQLLVGENPHVKGKADAAITITEFSDFQCPACKAAQPAVTEVLARFPDQVKVVYRHFPLTTIHIHAQMAAQASEVAAGYGKFWEYHDLLFAGQEEWSEMSPEKAKEQFVKYATDLGIDSAEFQEKIQSSEIKAQVAADAGAAEQLKLNSTPTVFVNNTRVTAPHQLVSAVESLLKQQ